MKYEISFTAWYLNPNRICQLLDKASLYAHLEAVNSHQGRNHWGSPAYVAHTAIKHELEAWLHSNAVPSLGELIINNCEIPPGTLFTVYQDFYGKGLSKYNNIRGALPRNAIAELHNKLKFEDDRRLRIIYSPENFITSSAWHRLSGKTRLYCFCYVETCNKNEIVARPYMIGDIHTGLELEKPSSWNGRNYGELHVSEIDQFSKIKSVYESENSAPRLNALKAISERKLKCAIAEIVNEDNIPKDWGGEKSDLFTFNLTVSNKHYTSAFLLKGPAKFTEMKMAHLGKNGDQIDRLFSEPADLLILQHCHKVSTSVRNTMRAFASRIHDLRYFAIIDGYDTLRLLNAYGKCGF